jgi:RimJ/RimL family protein N-acetyltransferase
MSPNREVVEEIDDGIIFLRKVTKDDFKFFFRALNNKETIKYISIGPLLSFRHSKNLIERYLGYWQKNEQYNYIIEAFIDELKEPIGAVSLWNLNWLHRRGEVGIWIKPLYWEQGFGKRTIELIKMVGFQHLHLHRLEAKITTQNHRSIYLFKTCGFKEECVLEEYLFLRGHYHNAMILGCLNNLEEIYSNRKN